MIMLQTSDSHGALNGTGYRRIMSVLLWLSLTTGWIVSIFSVVEELCLATACSDAASFTLFGAPMGWFGIAYFSFLLLVLWLRPKNSLLNLALAAMVFSGIGAEFRLLWIQKYIIGGWCPLCVSICCALFFAAALLLIENVQDARSGEGSVKRLLGWLALMTAMVAIGLSIAVVGIKALV
jgi:hypothetical protein